MNKKTNIGLLPHVTQVQSTTEMNGSRAREIMLTQIITPSRTVRSTQIGSGSPGSHQDQPLPLKDLKLERLKVLRLSMPNTAQCENMCLACIRSQTQSPTRAWGLITFT